MKVFTLSVAATADVITEVQGVPIAAEESIPFRWVGGNNAQG